MLLGLLAGTSLFAALRQRLKASAQRMGVTLALLALAAFFFALTVLYLVHAFYIWLSGFIGMPLAALATAGAMLVFSGIFLAIVSARSKRRQPEPSAMSQTAAQFGQTAGLAAASRLFRSRHFRNLRRKIPPRYAVLGIGVVLSVLAFSLMRGSRRDED